MWDPDRIVRRVLAGYTQAYAELVKHYEAMIWRIASVMLRDRSATENLVQQVFIDAYTHLEQYGQGTDFGAWLRTVARNRLRKELRSASREDRRLKEYHARLLARLNAEAPTPADDADLYLQALQHCRAALSERDSRLLQLRYERALSFDEIAEMQKQTPAAVQRMISRIRLQLRDCIQSKVQRS